MKPAVTYTLKVRLLETRPAIWRRLIVPADIVLARLHSVIQAAMGWSHSTPYFFIAQGAFYAEDLEPFRSLRDGRKTTLATLLQRPGDWIRYSLHAGEGWEHAIELEDAVETQKRLRFARCAAGERRCPPEDCGGPRRFAELLKALARDHRSKDPFATGNGGRKPRRRPNGNGQSLFQGWFDGPFDPKAFDVVAASAELKRVRM